MAVVATECALDLSSKSESKTCSPVPSVTSEPEVCERSSSVSSEGHETDGSTGTAVKPVLGPLPTGHLLLGDGKVSQRIDPGNMSPGGPLSPLDPANAATNRPFKMYPFDSVPNMNMYSQMAAAAAASSQMSQMTGTGGMAPFALFDSAISLSSPIGQYLQQRKRRLETRQPRTKSEEFDCSISDKVNLNGNSSSGSGGEGTPDAKRAKSDDIMMDMGSKDDAYWERRRKNNEAAKRSRDARRAKEEEIALRAAFLEQENLKLRAQVAILKNETAKLHYMLYNRV